jgi:hypothetical protein
MTMREQPANVREWPAHNAPLTHVGGRACLSVAALSLNGSSSSVRMMLFGYVVTGTQTLAPGSSALSGR